eukprot:5855104-Amphidinium_carterae.1
MGLGTTGKEQQLLSAAFQDSTTQSAVEFPKLAELNRSLWSALVEPQRLCLGVGVACLFDLAMASSTSVRVKGNGLL